MEKLTVKKETVLAILNYLAEQKFKDVANLFLSLEQEVAPQLQVQVQQETSES